MTKQEAISNLKDKLKKGDTLYTVVKQVSSSGMYRHIGVYVVKKNQIVWLSGLVAKALGWKFTKTECVGVRGCGMDMGFHLVYSLSSTLYYNGKNNGKAGYFLKQHWL